MAEVKRFESVSIFGLTHLLATNVIYSNVVVYDCKDGVVSLDYFTKDGIEIKIDVRNVSHSDVLKAIN